MSTGTQTEVVMPQMGVSVSEGTVTKWLRQVGDAIGRDEPLLEISTDKVDTEVPSPAEGVVTQILVQEGETVEVGTVLATIAPAGAEIPPPAAEPAPEPAAAPAAPAPAPQPEPVVAAAAPPPLQPSPRRPSLQLLRPQRCTARDAGRRGERQDLRLTRGRAHRRRARRRPGRGSRHGDRWPRDEEGHPDLHRVGRGSPTSARTDSCSAGRGSTASGSRAGRGRRARSGASAACSSRAGARARRRGARSRCSSCTSASCSAAPPPAAAPVAAQAELAPGEELEPMSAMRRGVMAHMRRSVDTAAHVTSAIEVDMARVVALRTKLKPELAAQKVNLTYLAFIARATVDTLLDYPWVNGELRGQSIVTRPYVNLGIAVALDEGKGLIVPVIRNAQDLNLTGTARAIQDIAERARTKKLLPDDVQGGTFTITNPGSFGTFHGTPIINQPQSAILGTYALVKRPWVIQDDLGSDVIAIRPVMNLTLTYDHRLVDGAYAGMCLRDIRDRLESWDEAAY